VQPQIEVKMGGNGAKDSRKVRISVTLRADIYQEIKRLSHDLGIKPASWIAMTLTAKVNDIELNARRK